MASVRILGRDQTRRERCQTLETLESGREGICAKVQVQSFRQNTREKMQRMVRQGLIYIQLGRKLLEFGCYKRQHAEYLLGRRVDRKDPWKTRKGQ